MEGNISEIPTVTPTFSTMPDSTMTLPTVFDVCRLPEFKMAGSKPEVDLSQERNGLSAKFQRLPPIFGVELFDGAFAETIRRLLLPEIQGGGR